MTNDASGATLAEDAGTRPLAVHESEPLLQATLAVKRGQVERPLPGRLCGGARTAPAKPIAEIVKYEVESPVPNGNLHTWKVNSVLTIPPVTGQWAT